MTLCEGCRIGIYYDHKTRRWVHIDENNCGTPRPAKNYQSGFHERKIGRAIQNYKTKKKEGK